MMKLSLNNRRGVRQKQNQIILRVLVFVAIQCCPAVHAAFLASKLRPPVKLISQFSVENRRRPFCEKNTQALTPASIKPLSWIHTTTASARMSMNDDSQESSQAVSLPALDLKVLSLAGPFLVECVFDTASLTAVWSLFPISSYGSVAGETSEPSEGLKAWTALMEQDFKKKENPANEEESADAAMLALRCRLPKGNLLNIAEVSVSKSNTNSDDDKVRDDDLVNALSRILIQWWWNRLRQTQKQQEKDNKEHRDKNWTVRVPVCDEQHETTDLVLDLASATTITSNTGSLWELFRGLADPESSELVEMVDRQGRALGIVPRKLVHKHNLLHRGIGMFVSQNQPILFSPTHGTKGKQKQPALYVHRRTTTKRIFPDLYDMFVGGVSLAGEDATTTASREVAEELGLTAGLQEGVLSISIEY